MMMHVKTKVILTSKDVQQQPIYLLGCIKGNSDLGGPRLTLCSSLQIRSLFFFWYSEAFILKQILQTSFKPHAKFLQWIEILLSYMETRGTDMERLRNITLKMQLSRGSYKQNLSLLTLKLILLNNTAFFKLLFLNVLSLSSLTS